MTRQYAVQMDHSHRVLFERSVYFSYLASYSAVFIKVKEKEEGDKYSVRRKSELDGFFSSSDLHPSIFSRIFC